MFVAALFIIAESWKTGMFSVSEFEKWIVACPDSGRFLNTKNKWAMEEPELRILSERPCDIAIL